MGRRPLTEAQMIQRQDFGALLRTRREKLGLGLRQAASLAEMDHSLLSRIESGKRPTSIQDLPGLEKAYQVPLETLQIARSSQMPLSLIRYLFKPQGDSKRRDERLDVRVTPEEKRNLALFLGYLRFKQRA